MIEKASFYSIEFWKEISDTTPNISRIQHLGANVADCVQNIHLQFAQLTEINPTHVLTYSIYGNFLKYVGNEESQSEKVLEK